MTELSSLTQEEQQNLFRARRNVIKMLQDRGYIIDETDMDMDFNTFSVTFFTLTSLNGIYERADGSGRIKTKFDTPTTHRLNSKDVGEFLNEAKHDNVGRMILILRLDNMTTIVRQNLERLRKSVIIECFDLKEVLINITEHELVPKHEPLTEEQKQDFLARYHLQPCQLPRIQRTDPVVRYYGVEPGTVLKITRRSEVAGRYVTYRLVC